MAKLFAVVTFTRPVEPAPTVAMMDVGDTTVYWAGAPPKETLVMLLKSIPVIVTTVPEPPLVGVNEVMARSFDLLFIRMDIDETPLLTTGRSGTPSPSISAGATHQAWELAR